MADQSEFTRWRRLQEGRCPTHGIGMSQVGVDEEVGPVEGCDRDDCDFAVFHLDRRPEDAVPGASRLVKWRTGWAWRSNVR